MTRIILSTVYRNVDPVEVSGKFVVFDAEKKEIIRKSNILEAAFRYDDPNPRGGFRGAKGITGNSEIILLSSSNCIYVFDKNWELLNTITHPSCSGIHDIFLIEDKVWVSSTRNDILFVFDLDGKLDDYIYTRSDKGLAKKLNWSRSEVLSSEDILNGAIDFRDPRSHKLPKYDAAHINSVTNHPDYGVLISLGLVVGGRFTGLLQIKDSLSRLGLWKYVIGVNHFVTKLLRRKKDMHSDLVVQPAKGSSVVARVLPSKEIEPVLVLEGQHIPSHSVIPGPDGSAFYMNSTPGNIVHFHPGTGKVISSTHVTEQFLRGGFVLNDHVLITGAQNSLLYFDYQKKEILDRVWLSDYSREAVFAIAELPDHFALPPKSFEEKVGRTIGFEGNRPVFSPLEGEEIG